MKIISGKYKSRNLVGYNHIARPTIARIRESLFAIINPFLKEAVVLDLFAGTGALGIEALSNGAQKCVFVEKDHKMLEYLGKNLSFVEEDYSVIKGDFRKISGQYDIIFLDPPYQSNYLQIALDLIAEKNLLKEGGLVVCEFVLGDPKSELLLFKQKKYGNKNIIIFKKNGGGIDGKGPDC